MIRYDTVMTQQFPRIFSTILATLLSTLEDRKANKIDAKVDYVRTFVLINWNAMILKMIIWVFVKNGNRNDRIRNGKDRNRKRPRNFLRKFKFLAISCRKFGGDFRFRSFPSRIRSFRFPSFTETLIILLFAFQCYIFIVRQDDLTSK